MKRNSLLLAAIILVLAGSPALALEIEVTADPNLLVDTIMGGGISILGTPTYSGGTLSSGTFTGGGDAGLGFESGVMLTTGEAPLLDGPNKNSFDPSFTPELIGDGAGYDTYTDLGLDGDEDLTDLSGYETYDAAVLEFDFVSDGGKVYFNYVFGSEEYVNYVDTSFNDVFGFWLDGVNFALVPGTDTPVTINTINPLSNSEYYRNNIDYLDADGNLVPAAGFDVEFDGLTTVLTVESGYLEAGTHHMKIAIADASDGILDAGVFIQAGTFSDQPTSVPEPSTFLLLGTGMGGVLLLRRRWRG